MGRLLFSAGNKLSKLVHFKNRRFTTTLASTVTSIKPAPNCFMFSRVSRSLNQNYQSRGAPSFIRAPGSCSSNQSRFITTLNSNESSVNSASNCNAQVVKKAVEEAFKSEIMEQHIKKALHEALMAGHVEENVKKAVEEVFRTTNVEKLVENAVNEAFICGNYDQPLKQVVHEAFEKHKTPYGTLLYWGSIVLSLGLFGISTHASSKDRDKVIGVVTTQSKKSSDEREAQSKILLDNVMQQISQLLKDLIKEERARSWFGWITSSKP